MKRELPELEIRGKIIKIRRFRKYALVIYRIEIYRIRYAVSKDERNEVFYC